MLVLIAACQTPSTSTTPPSGVSRPTESNSFPSAPLPEAGPAPTPTSAPTCPCGAHTYTWGGTPCLCEVNRHTLGRCREYGSVSRVKCKGTASCESAAEIDRVMSHPDVIAALARAPVTFGHAAELSEGGDGFQFSVDGKNVVVFEKCGLPTSATVKCELPPAGVLAVKKYLTEHPPMPQNLTCGKP